MVGTEGWGRRARQGGQGGFRNSFHSSSMCRSTEGSTWGGRGVRQAAVSTIRLGTYNIRNSRNGGLDSELRGMSQANIDLGIFQETKVTAGIHTRESSGYRVVASDALSTLSSCIAMFYRTRGGTLLREGAPAPWCERRELSDGVGRPVVVHRGVLLGPRRRLDNRGRCSGHQPEAPGGRSAGGRKF